MMSEAEIREFVDEATAVSGDRVTVTERITQRWLTDRQAAADDARDAIYDDQRDSWNGGEGA